MTQSTILQTKRLRIRPVVSADLSYVYQGLSDPEVIRYYGVSYDSLEACKEQMTWFDSLEREGTGKWWVLEDNETSAFVGAAGFNNWEQVHQKTEIGLWLLPAYWSRGYMQEAIPALISYGFDVMRLHRIEGYVESENTKCKSALNKLGFSHEGTLVDCEIKNDRFISLDIYAKLNV